MKTKIISIQLLRAAACLLVLQCHFLPKIPLTGLTFAGNIGVDLFFIISGYIIASSLDHLPGNKPASSFLINRISRIVPFYYFITLIAAALIYLRFQEFDFLKLIESFAFTPLIDDPTLEWGWSLNHEMMFYTFVGLALLYSPYANHLNIALGFCLVVFAASVIRLDSSSKLSYTIGFVGSNLNYLFFFGFLIYKFKKILLPIFKSYWTLGLSILVFLLVPIIGGEIGNSMPYRRDWINLHHIEVAIPRLLIWGLPSALLFLCLLAQEDRLQDMRNSIFVKIGDASYSIYLFQGLIIILLGRPLIRSHFIISCVLALTIIVISLRLVLLETYLANGCKRILNNMFMKKPSTYPLNNVKSKSTMPR